MKQIFSRQLYLKHRGALLMLTDLTLVAASFFIAFMLKLDNGIAYYLKAEYLPRYIIVLAAYAVSFLAFRIHDSLWSYLDTRELVIMALSVIAATGVIVVYLELTSVQSVLTKIAIIAGILCVSLMLNVRVLYRMFVRRKSKDGLSPALIIGAGDGGYLTLKEVEKNKSFRADVVGFIDDARPGKALAGKRVLGTTSELSRIVEKYSVKKIFISMPSASVEDRRRIIALSQEAGVSEIKIMRRSDLLLVDDSEAYPIKPVSIADLLGRGEADLNVDQISGYLEGKRVLVTGAGGSIGSVLCSQIARFRPSKLILLDVYENNMYELEQDLKRTIMRGALPSGIEIVAAVGSVRDRVMLSALFSAHAPQVVFHAAAHKHVPLMEGSPVEAVKNNVLGTRNVAQAAIAAGCERFILISTDKAVNPSSVMGATKRIGEIIIQALAPTSPTRMAAVRFGNVLGSNGSVIPLFEKQIAEGGPVTVTHRDIERYFMTIPEAAQLVMQAGSFADKGEIFVLDMGSPVKIIDLAEKMIRLSGFRPYEDIDVIEIGLREGEKMYEELSLDEEDVSLTGNKSIFVAKPQKVDMRALEEWLEFFEGMALSGETDPGKVRAGLFEAVSALNPAKRRPE